ARYRSQEPYRGRLAPSIGFSADFRSRRFRICKRRPIRGAPCRGGGKLSAECPAAARQRRQTTAGLHGLRLSGRTLRPGLACASADDTAGAPPPPDAVDRTDRENAARPAGRRSEFVAVTRSVPGSHRLAVEVDIEPDRVATAADAHAHGVEPGLAI